MRTECLCDDLHESPLGRGVPGHESRGRTSRYLKRGDYEVFVGVLSEALSEHPAHLLPYGIMPNH